MVSHELVTCNSGCILESPGRASWVLAGAQDFGNAGNHPRWVSWQPGWGVAIEQMQDE